jgi:hypothetical protein
VSVPPVLAPLSLLQRKSGPWLRVKGASLFGRLGDGGDPPAIDPIIGGLLKRLPKTGDVWPGADRKLWLQLPEGSFKLIYKDAPEEPPRVGRTTASPFKIRMKMKEAAN